ncbi:hypothetical protein CAPTEDRAFT_214218 [Capitella teleta]|uniref:Uncharacterized protein n=1 Tax=Capitella teleta TaxID=283909 RepID=R7U5T4_CAPTE|nr:hypothetical protein CAPTEDRAFT_214218 [Capitella teleta]|eukprot:ELU01344.1 hypothetical protein CAPTEDRAFT_214218 [Capitella teleta]
MGRKKTTTPSGKTLNDAVYCNILNCSNNSLTSIDPRTGKIVRFHSWPHPDKVGETVKDAAVKKAEKLELPSLAEESEVQQYERMLAIPALEENMLRATAPDGEGTDDQDERTCYAEPPLIRLVADPAMSSAITLAEEAVVANTCGSIVRKKYALSDKTCTECLPLLFSTDAVPQHDLILLREFSDGALKHAYT